jgi:hypothetical protein
VMVRKIRAQLSIEYHAIQEKTVILWYWKVCSYWIPYLLMDEHKICMGCHHGCFYDTLPNVWQLPVQHRNWWWEPVPLFQPRNEMTERRMHHVT